MALAWLALLASAPIGLHLSKSAELPRAEAMNVVRELAVAIEDRTGRTVVVDDLVWSGCEVADPCIDDLRTRTRTDEIVLVRVVAGLTLLRVSVLRVGGAPIEVDVDRTDLRGGVRALAARLYLQGRPKILPTPKAPTVETDPTPSVLPWVAAGSAAVALAVGVGFGISSRGARSDSQDPNLPRGDFDRLADRTQSHAVVADVSFVAGAALGALAGILWWTD